MDNLLSVFDFVLPTKIIYGFGQLNTLARELSELGASKPIIITDRGIVGAGIAKKITGLLDGVGTAWTMFDGVEPNPKDKNVEAATVLAREFGADSIVALGGGSPIDCAKSVGVLLAHNADKIKKYEGKTAATLPLPPMIAIPTTAGTGSELTFSSVINDTENNYKMTIKSKYTAARVAICDPELTLTVPPSITAATGVDALTHAIEAYTATCSEPISDACALYACELIGKHLVPAVKNGQNREARAGMLMASMLGGVAFSHSDVASVHCLAESLGGVFDVPHGVCNAILLPYMMEYCADHCATKYARVAQCFGLEFGTSEQGAQKAVDYVKRLACDVELPPFSSMNVSESDFDKICEMSVKNISTESNPRPMTKQDYMNVLKMAAQG